MKLEHRRFGPFKILAAIGTKAYKLELAPSMKIHPVFHVARLKPYQANEIPGRVVSPPPPLETEQGEEYEVEQIINSHWVGRPKRFEYLVKWVGYGPANNTWEPIANVANAQELVKEFHEQHLDAASPDHPPQPLRHRS